MIERCKVRVRRRTSAGTVYGSRCKRLAGPYGRCWQHPLKKGEKA